MLGRGGVFFNNNWLSLTSLVSCIVKTNNRTVHRVPNAQNYPEYNINKVLISN
jgi:hypothetical protein